jgi:O-antigen/teichoic acid export membrane protein
VLCLAGNGLLSLCAAGLGIAASLCCLHLFTDTPVPVAWLLAQAVIIIAAGVGNTASFLQRLSQQHRTMGRWQVFNQSLFLVLLLPPLIWTASIDGYYVGCVVASLVTTATAIGLLYRLCRRHLDLPMPGRNWSCAWPDFRSRFRALFFCNLLGYGKMLHRGFDVLLVGLFAGDRLTGIYRLARSLTDGVGFLSDALNQVYWPRLLGLLRRDDSRAFRFEARRLLLAATGVTVCLLLLEIWILPLLNTHLLSAEFSGITPLMLVLTVPFLFTAGLHLWIWPIVVHREYLPQFTTYSGVAVAAHYGIALGGLVCFPATVLPAAVGYLAYYPLLYFLSCWKLMHISPELTPFPTRLGIPQRLGRHPRGGTAL